MADICVIGSFVMDMVARVKEFPQDGQTILGLDLNCYPGGKGANQCVAMARLGANVEMVGMLGNDGNGQVFLDLLKQENVESKNVFITDKCPTSVAQVQINERSENKIVVIPSANFMFNKENLLQAKESIKQSKLVVLQLELNEDVTHEIIDLCYDLGVDILLNPAPARKLSKEYLSKITYITPNETELSILADMPTETEEEVKKATQKLLSYGVKNVIATLGKRGASITNTNETTFIGGYKVDVVDTVAAGDSFNGALAKCIVDGKTLSNAVKFANAVGALTVTKKGAIPSLPNLKEVEKFINK